MGTLIMREFANDNEVIAMFEEEPWKSHFASHMLTSTTLTKLINEDRTRTFLRQAVGNAISSFLPTRASQFVNNPKLFTWTVTILTTWEYDPLTGTGLQIFSKVPISISQLGKHLMISTG